MAVDVEEVEELEETVEVEFEFEFEFECEGLFVVISLILGSNALVDDVVFSLSLDLLEEKTCIGLFGVVEFVIEFVIEFVVEFVEFVAFGEFVEFVGSGFCLFSGDGMELMSLVLLLFLAKCLEMGDLVCLESSESLSSTLFFLSLFKVFFLGPRSSSSSSMLSYTEVSTGTML